MTALAGIFAAILHFAGALKSTPLLAALPFDLTAVAAMALLVVLPLPALASDWHADPLIALPLGACGALWLWLVLAGAWSPSTGILAAKLQDVVLLGPVMLAAGLAIAAQDRALAHCANAVLAIGAVVAASIAWGLATDRIVLGGLPGASPDQTRVQYQIAGLAIASAAALAAVRAAEAPRVFPRLLWLGFAFGLSAVVLLPGGRAALLALALALATAPAIALWRSARRGLAMLWPAAVLLATAAVLAMVLADPPLATGLRTLERLSEGEVAQSSGRLPLWRAAAEKGGEAMPWGLGTGGFTVAAGHGERRGLYPHNHLLEAMAEGGLPGLVLWLIAFGGGGLAAVRLGAQATVARAARVAALALPVALSIMVSTDLGNRMAWFALGLALGLGLRAEPRHVPALRQAGL
ncbi:O-antigen ligase family protein [Roseomonas sp. HJA6]|uniref:O-antigen ligase family protein n=1 Tax=Roseomonas alba TaxID=2846776 RepID=A0ABS7AAE5_9PROT|nr:O-antigen ligase family protein [Neoroseomonas alba]MBW6398285.1 O-antigen ligase family protein [Neoroseomonas alba]